MSFLTFSGITKRFPGVLALDQVGFEVERGSCHALIGENGAGKSTLGKILAGINQADSGDIFLDGRPIRPASPLAARGLGIAMVHQELAFCPNLSVAENLCLGDLPRGRTGWVDRTTLLTRARAMLATIGANDIDPGTLIGTLSTGHEQLVQIAAAVGTGARILIMDEPTSSLSAGETHVLFKLIRDLKARGITLIYVSHRMEELFALCDTITVLRDGRHVATEPIARTSPQRVITHMIGRDLAAWEPAHLAREPGPVKLEVAGLSSPGKFANLGLCLRAGEIVGLAGLVGAGRSEFVQALFGLDPAATGSIHVDGQPLPIGSVDAALAAGIGLVPEDRKRQGLVLGLNCRENLALANLPNLTRFGWVHRNAERVLSGRFLDRLRVRTPSPEAPVEGLSGGNQQKIALAKWLARDCSVLLIDEPTRGVDIGAKTEIHRLLDELACAGQSLLVVSSELPELIGLCNRILVLREGRLAGELPRAQFSETALMQLMAGVPAAA